MRPHRRSQCEGAGGAHGAEGRLQHEIAPRAMHPIENLNAPVIAEIGQSHRPALVDNDRTDRSVEAAALWAFLTSVPGRMDRPDKVEIGMALRRQCDRHFALAKFGVGFWRFIVHA